MNALNDMRSYSRHWIKEFIAVYKSEECLWQTKHPDYNNHFTRNQAYDKLVEKLKEVEANADRAMVVRKVNSLRSAFRREYRKKYENSNYEPKLWYYDALLFIADQNACSKRAYNGRKPKTEETLYQIKIDPAQSEEEIVTDDNEIEQEDGLLDEEQEIFIKRNDKPQSNNNASANAHPVQIIKMQMQASPEQEIQTVNTIEAQHNHSYHSQQQQQQEQQSHSHITSTPVTHSIQSIPLSKEQFHALINQSPPQQQAPPQIQHSNTTTISGIRHNDEFDAIGMNVASKLRMMNSTQRIIAEKLISDVLFNGQLDSLSVTSRISNH